MHKIEYSTQFKKDFKAIKKRSIQDIVDIGYVIKQLQQSELLAEKYVDHALSGNWHGYRDCHIKPGLVLIYKIESDILKLARIGSHSEIFG